MEKKKEGLSCEDVRKLDIVAYLSTLGIEPVQIKGNDFWYLSPLRIEKTPSFKVNRKMNAWYDHGMGKGGNLVDFAILYYNCSVGEMLKIFNEPFSLHLPASAVAKTPSVPQPKTEVLAVAPLRAPELLLYLRERRIPAAIAELHCHEITYRFDIKKYCAIGFRNDLGGYEIRNRYFKGSSSPKSFTHIRNGAAQLLVFEGFFDFLSYLAITAGMDTPPQDFLILNSLSFVAQALPILGQYEVVRLFLDNDAAGRNATSYICAQDERFRDESSQYRLYKDIGDFLTGKLMPGSPAQPGAEASL